MFRARFAPAVALAITLLFAIEATAQPPAVARPVLASGLSFSKKGIVFFVDTPSSGVAAIGTAHTLELESVATAGRIEFMLGNSAEPVAASSGFVIPPGKPFSSPGGTLGEDYCPAGLTMQLE